MGYCFGGTTVLQFAGLEGAAAAGVLSGASFNGTSGGVAGMKSMFCPTRVAVFRSARDGMIANEELIVFQETLETRGT